MKLKYILFLLILPSALWSQNSTVYSRYGIGDIEYYFNAPFGAIGGLNTAFNEGTHISTLNPASWNSFTQTRFELSGRYDGLFVSGQSESSYFGNAEFGGLAIGFPVSQLYGIGVGLGLIPYTNVSYQAKDVVATSINEPITYTYEGKGGLSKIFLGTSYRLPVGLSLGASFDYYFGNIEYFSRSSFSSNSFLAGEFEKKYSPKGIGTTVGLISPDFSYMFNSESISRVFFGLSASIIGTLSTDTSLVKFSSASTDTIGSGVVYMKLPFRINAGIGMVLNKTYLLNLDYSYQPWSNYEFNELKSANLRDAHKVSAGIQFKREKEFGASFWEQIIWRAGVSYEQTQYMIRGIGINQYSVGGGFSLPMGNQNSVDISVLYSMRGTTENNLFKENRIALSLGISLGEVWFIRQSN